MKEAILSIGTAKSELTTVPHRPTAFYTASGMCELMDNFTINILKQKNVRKVAHGRRTI